MQIKVNHKCNFYFMATVTKLTAFLSWIASSLFKSFCPLQICNQTLASYSNCDMFQHVSNVVSTVAPNLLVNFYIFDIFTGLLVESLCSNFQIKFQMLSTILAKWRCFAAGHTTNYCAHATPKMLP